MSSLRLTRAILLPAPPDRSAVAEPVRPTVHARGPSPAVRRYRGRMPSGTHPEEPEDTASQMENADTGEIPVHPDDRLWRHPSEMGAARRAEVPAPRPERVATVGVPRVWTVAAASVIGLGGAWMLARGGWFCPACREDRRLGRFVR